MNLSDFDYHLPAERIAQFPAEPRDSARLLVQEIASNETQLARVSELPTLLREGDLLVMNDTRVLPARLFGKRATGGQVEFLFVEPSSGRNGAWRAMVRPAKKLKAGEVIEAAGGELRLRMLERLPAEHGGASPLWEVQLEESEGSARELESELQAHGSMPLPPYIEREAAESDRDRYQTVYSKRLGAVAAPTAGLHFTPQLIEDLARAGIESTTLTLHVGLGTFLPVSSEQVDDHEMHEERYELSEECVDRVRACRRRGGRVIAVGTTSVRVLEACSSSGELRAGQGRTRIFIKPGYEFRSVDGLLTNFHLPKSTLLMLVSALAGRERILELYRLAIEAEMRFYSYGDAMLLLP